MGRNQTFPKPQSYKGELVQENNSSRRATLAAIFLSLLTFNSTPAQPIKRDSKETIDPTSATSVQTVKRSQLFSSLKTSSPTARHLVSSAFRHRESGLIVTARLIERHNLLNANLLERSHTCGIANLSNISLTVQSNTPRVVVSRLTRSSVLAERTRKR
jgi:hypothetical protein